MLSGRIAFCALLLPGIVCAQLLGIGGDASPTLQVPSGAPLSTPSAISACVTRCFTQAAKEVHCKDVTDAGCVCTQLLFPWYATDCIASMCPQDTDSATEFYRNACAAVASSLFPGPTAPQEGGTTSGTPSPTLETTLLPGMSTHTSSTSNQVLPVTSTSTTAKGLGTSTRKEAEPSSQPEVSSETPPSTSADDGPAQVVTTVLTQSDSSNTSTPLNPPVNGAPFRGLRQGAASSLAVLVATNIVVLCTV